MFSKSYMSVLYQTVHSGHGICGFGSTSFGKVIVHQHVHHLLPVATTHHSFIVLRIRSSVPAVLAKEDGHLHDVSALVNVVPVIVDENRSSNSLAHLLLGSSVNSTQHALQLVTVTRPQIPHQDFLNQSGIMGLHPLACNRFDTLRERQYEDATAWREVTI